MLESALLPRFFCRPPAESAFFPLAYLTTPLCSSLTTRFYLFTNKLHQAGQQNSIVYYVNNPFPHFPYPEMNAELSINVMGSSPPKGKRSKRPRAWYSLEEDLGPSSYSDSIQEDEHDESEDEEMAAHSLMLLSHDSSPNRFPTPRKRVIKKTKEFRSADSPYEGEKRSSYKCKTCGKEFFSFQALGGHRASCSHNTNLTADSEQPNEKSSISNKIKVHECTICFRVFSSGQALGGHKRTHSTTPPSHSSLTEKEYEQRADLDLNMPAPLDDWCPQTEDSSAVPCSTAVRSHYNEYKLSHPFWWMTSSGKRVPSVYNGNIADDPQKQVLVGRDLGLKQDLFTVAAVN